jgi:hypothetical protein
MPVCEKCAKQVSFDDMHYQTNRSKDGRYMSSHCMECEREYQFQYKKRKANLKVPLALPNDHPFSTGRTSNECGEFKLAKNFNIGRDGRSFKAIAMQSKCKSCKEIQKSKAFIKRRYGITYEEYLQRLKDQDNKCAIWRSSVHKNKRTGKLVQTLFIDHDHSTGKVRGLLCSPCNHGLGQFKDNKAALFRAIKYLTQ